MVPRYDHVDVGSAPPADAYVVPFKRRSTRGNGALPVKMLPASPHPHPAGCACGNASDTDDNCANC